jgi:hypothetical protein
MVPLPELNKMFVGLYGELSDGATAVADEQLAAVLANGDPSRDDLILFAKRQLSSVSLAPRQMGLIKAASAIISDFYHQAAFHPQLAEKLFAASGALIGEAVRTQEWLSDKSHPLSLFIDEMAEVAQGWCPAHSQAGDVADLLCEVMKGLCGESQHDSIARFRSWRSTFDTRVDKISARLVQGESGTLKAQYSRGMAARTINRQVAGRDLPQFMLDALEKVWQPAFQWLLLDQGEKSDLWNKLVRNFSLLIWSLQANAAEHKQKFQRVTEQLKVDLTSLLAQVVTDSGSRSQLLDDIQIYHALLLHGREVESFPYQPLQGSAVLDAVDAEVSADLLEEISNIRKESWFVIADVEKRIRLVHRNDEYQQLLFTDQIGIKTLSCSFEDFAYQYSSGMITLSADVVPFFEWAQAKLQALSDRYEERLAAAKVKAKEQALLRESQAQQRDAAKAAAREDARRLAEDEAARRNAQQALINEEQALEAEQREIEDSRRQAVAGELGHSDEQRRQRARLTISGLVVGVWLSFHDESGEQVRRKLAVILPSSGKYIFVDRNGADKVELNKDGLITGLASGAIALLHRDERFDDALSRVVGGIQGTR